MVRTRLTSQLRRIGATAVAAAIAAGLALAMPGAAHAAEALPGLPAGLNYSSDRAGTWAAGNAVTGGALASCAQPAIKADRVGNLHLVCKGATGLYYFTRTLTGSWSSPRLIAGTVAADGAASLDVSPNSVVTIAFSRASGTPGIYVVGRTSTGEWGVLSRRTTTAGDLTPAIAVDGAGKAHVVFSRTAGTAALRGLYYMTDRPGAWTTAAAITGTAAGDVEPALVVGFNGVLKMVAFARTSGQVGVYLSMSDLKGTWTTPGRGSTVADRLPKLVVDPSGRSHIVVQRASGATAGLVHVTNIAGRWAATRIAGTAAGDVNAVLAIAGSDVHLAFKRPSGATAGIHVASFGTRWSALSRRATVATAAQTPTITTDASNRAHVVW